MKKAVPLCYRKNRFPIIMRSAKLLNCAVEINLNETQKPGLSRLDDIKSRKGGGGGGGCAPF